jgi:hypothetical protein
VFLFVCLFCIFISLLYLDFALNEIQILQIINLNPDICKRISFLCSVLLIIDFPFNIGHTRHRRKTNKTIQHRKLKRSATRTPPKIEGEPRCSRMVSSSCFVLDTRRVTCLFIFLQFIILFNIFCFKVSYFFPVM